MRPNCPADFTREIALPAPITGEVVRISEFADELIKYGFKGEGCLMLVSGNSIYAPVTGIITLCPTLGYEIALKASNGLKVNIKVGAHTHVLMGEKWLAKVKVGQKVEAGELLAQFNPLFLKQNDITTHCAVTITNSDKLKGIVLSSHRYCVANEDTLMHLYI